MNEVVLTRSSGILCSMVLDLRLGRGQSLVSTTTASAAAGMDCEICRHPLHRSLVWLGTHRRCRHATAKVE
jgi:hypothetical protein